MRTDEGVRMPCRATRNSAGYDFFAKEDITLHAGEWTEVGTGVYLEHGDKVYADLVQSSPFSDELTVYTSYGGEVVGWCMLLLPKSGLGFKHGVRLANTVGVIDMDYRGEIKAKLTCDSDYVTIPAGKAFMQGVIVPFGVFFDEGPVTRERGTGGFGSTGV